jgi:low temperature requirement protein LtrA
MANGSATSPGYPPGFELFFDLVFAAAVALWSEAMAERAIGAAEYARYAVFLFMIWWVWVLQAAFASRFPADALLHKGLATAQILAVGVMAIALTTTPGATLRFPLAFVAAQAALLVQYVEARRAQPGGPAVARIYAIKFAMTVAVVLASLFVVPALRPAFWGAAVGLDFVVLLLAGRALTRVPLDPARLVRRMISFTSLLLFVSIDALVRGLARAWTPWTIIVAALSFALVSFAWRIYAIHVSTDRLQTRWWSGQAFVYVHSLLVLGVAASSVGIHLAIESGGVGQGSARSLLFIDVGLFMWLLAVALLHRLAGSGQDTAVNRAFLGALVAFLVVVVGGARAHPFVTLALLAVIFLALDVTESFTHGFAPPRQAGEQA